MGFRLMAEEGGQARLRIEIDRKDAISMQCQILGKVSSRCRLTAAALEIHNRDHLQVIVWAASGAVTAVGARALIERAT